MLWLIAAGSEDLKEPKIDATPAKLAFRLRACPNPMLSLRSSH